MVLVVEGGCIRNIQHGTILQHKPESWNMTVLQPKPLEKKETQHKSSQAHIPTFWRLHLYLYLYLYPLYRSPLKGT